MNEVDKKISHFNSVIADARASFKLKLLSYQEMVNRINYAKKQLEYWQKQETELNKAKQFLQEMELTAIPLKNFEILVIKQSDSLWTINEKEFISLDNAAEYLLKLWHRTE